MNFIEQLLGIENRWAILGILVALQLIICAVVCKTTKKALWGWLTLVVTALFIIVYIWKYPWLFRIVGALFAFGPGQLVTSILVPGGGSSHKKKDHPIKSKLASLPLLFNQGFYNSLRGNTVDNPQIGALYVYVAFLCVDILGVDPEKVFVSSDFNNDLGADSSDVEAFVQHIGNEILVPNDLVGKAKKWLDFLRYSADSNETNGSYKFPLNTVKDMAFALFVFKPRRIEYPE